MTGEEQEKFKISDEQQNIIDLLEKDSNVVVDAVAGAGKSTTVLYIAEHYLHGSGRFNHPNGKILQITYNSSLRQEIREKVEKKGYTNLEVHTYHSFGVKYYLNEAKTDTGLRRIIREKQPPKSPIPSYFLIVLDEVQDTTMLYFHFIVKALYDMKSPFQLLILGDYMQGLYEFKGSDTRFLTMAETIWKSHGGLLYPSFTETTLKTSYRITHPMARFVNEIMLGETRLEACRDGDPVVYIRNNKFNLERTLIYEIQKLLKEGSSPSDIFILSASMRNESSHIRRIENLLVERGILCNIPLIETERIDDKVIQGKVVFSTFHCVKGRQRPYVFVIGFDHTYMTRFARDEPKDVCPNTLYVACTRGSKRLYLFEEDGMMEDRPLSFLKQGHHYMKKSDYVDFIGTPRSIFHSTTPHSTSTSAKTDNDDERPKHFTTPTDLIRFLPEEVFDHICPILDDIFTIEQQPQPSPIDIPIIYQMTRGNFEEISDLNGIAIPCMYYDKFLRDLNVENEEADIMLDSPTTLLYDIIQYEVECIKKANKANKYQHIIEMAQNLPKICSSIQDYLYLANIYVGFKEKVYFKIHQISYEDYTWLSPESLQKCFDIIHNAIYNEFQGDEDDMLIAEETISTYDDDYTIMDELLIQNNIELFRFNARVDLITPKTVWEIKCTNDITIEHLLQVVIYAWIWKHSSNSTNDKTSPRNFKIINVKTGEIRTLDTNNDSKINEIMFHLLRSKYIKSPKLTTEEFVQECENIMALETINSSTNHD